MSNDPNVDARQIYEALKRLHEMEQQQSATANLAVAEVMNWLERRINSNVEFLSLFGHLVPQEMHSEPPPTGGTPPPAPLPWEVEEAMRGGPPPLPTGARPILPPGTYDDNSAGAAFEQGRSMHGGRR